MRCLRGNKYQVTYFDRRLLVADGHHASPSDDDVNLFRRVVDMRALATIWRHYDPCDDKPFRAEVASIQQYVRLESISLVGGRFSESSNVHDWTIPSAPTVGDVSHASTGVRRGVQMATVAAKVGDNWSRTSRSGKRDGIPDDLATTPLRQGWGGSHGGEHEQLEGGDHSPEHEATSNDVASSG